MGRWVDFFNPTYGATGLDNLLLIFCRLIVAIYLIFHIMTMITKIFGQRVRYFRKCRSLSQEELAAVCELHRTYIGGIERGERNVSLNNVEKIARALDVPIAYLFIESNNENGI